MAENQRPNVLVIMSDQHHMRYMGWQSDGKYHTPAIDALAARGAGLTNAYTNFPLCGPSRMCFMTGRMPSDIRVLDNGAELSSDIPTFAHGFMAGGYETILSGRMHFNGLDQRHGFEKRIIGDCSRAMKLTGWALDGVLGDLVDTPGYSAAGLIKSGPGVTGYQRYDELVTQTTVDWLSERGKTQDAELPFMMVAGYVTPHCPFVAEPDDYYRYHDTTNVDDVVNANIDDLPEVYRRMRRNAGLEGEKARPVGREEFHRTRAAYAGLCTFIDRQVGTVLDALEKAGLADNTIVVYTSDHGDQVGEHGMWWKSTFYEGSAGVPLIVAWPRHIKPGTRSNKAVSLMDIGPTLLQMTGCPAIPNAAGRSFASLLMPERADLPAWRDEVIVENIGQGDPSYGVHRMIRTGPWKYCDYQYEKPRLFNMDEDPQEMHNLADDPKYAATCAELKQRVLAGWDREAAQRTVREADEARPLLRAWVKQGQFIEPDVLWYESREIENRVDAVKQ